MALNLNGYLLNPNDAAGVAQLVRDMELTGVIGSLKLDAFGSGVPDAAQGVWVWPNVITIGNSMYFGFAGDSGGANGTGSVGLGRIDLRSGYCEYRYIGFIDGQDDHNVPALRACADGTVLAVFTGHAVGNELYTYRTAAPDSLERGAEDTITASGPVTYAQILIPGTGLHPGWHLFYRVGNAATGVWYLRYSSDEGRTWAVERPILNIPYVYFWSSPTSPDTIRFYCGINPGTVGDHNVYYGWLATNSAAGDMRAPSQVLPNTEFYGAVGAAMPIVPSAAGLAGLTNTLGASIGGAPASIRLLDSRRIDSNDTTAYFLAIEFTTADAGATGQLYRYQFGAAATPFTKKLVRAVGAPFYASTSYYYPGAAMTVVSPDVLIVGYQSGGFYWIDKMTTTDGGTTWTSVNIVKSINKLGRIQCINAQRFVYTEFLTYVDYQTYTSIIKFAAIP